MKAWLLGAGALMSLAARAHGQDGVSGSISGDVIDEAGNPLRGVKIVASSPTQIGGAKTTYTNDEGHYRFVQLQPGTFEVRASAPGFSRRAATGVKVGIGAPVDVNFVMPVESGDGDRVPVWFERGLVDTRSTKQGVDIGLDVVEALPMGSRDNIHQQMVNEVGGAMNGGIKGGTASQTQVLQDGFEMRGQFPTLKSTAGYQISTGGHGPENATAAGGLVNVVTKSGSNQYELEFNGTMDSSKLRLFTDGTDPRTPSYFYVINPQFSGPIVRDRLWFAFNMEWHIIQNGRDKDPLGYFPDPVAYRKQINKGTLKLTWQIAARHKLTATSMFDLPRERNMIDGLGVDRDAQQDRDAQRWFQGLILESVLGDHVAFRSQAGVILIPEDIYPARCRQDPVACDHIPSVQNDFPRTQQLGNRNNHQRNDLTSLQLQNRLEWFPDSKRFGEHDIVLHDRFYTEQEVQRTSRPGDMLTELNGADPLQRTIYYSNDPRYEPEHHGWWIGTDTVYRHLGTLSDSWRPDPFLTLTPALSHVWGTGSNSRGDTLVSTSTWAPSVGVAWDATHDGRTVVRSGFDTYVDVDFASIARHTLGSQTSQTCKWDANAQAFTGQCAFSGGLSKNTFGLPCGPTGLRADGTTCRESLRIPRTWEYTFGAEREVVQGVALSADLTYRKFLDQFARHETNRIWNPSGTQLDPIAGYRNGRNETIMDLDTPDGAQRRYAGVTIGAKKREGRLKIYAFYTLGVLEGNVFGLDSGYLSNPGRDVYYYGYLADDHRHEIKATLVYQLTRWFTAGVRYDYYSGRPYNRLFRNDVTGGFEDYRATRGTNPGANVNDPGDDRPLRLPDTQSLNLSLRLDWLPLVGHRLETYVDVLNVLALRTPTGLVEQDGPAWGSPTGSRMAPMQIRLGVNFRY